MFAKIALTALVILAALFFLRRASPRGRQRVLRPPEPLVECRKCGAYHPASKRCDCDMEPTPRK